MRCSSSIRISLGHPSIATFMCIWSCLITQMGAPQAVSGRRVGQPPTVGGHGNTIDTVDFFRLTVKDGQYLFDGSARPFERETRTIKVKQPDGSLREERLDVRRSVHGPVVYDRNGVTIAMRVAGLDRPKMLEQWFRMGEARTLEEFQAALRVMSVPMWHANYADDRGHICVFDCPPQAPSAILILVRGVTRTPRRSGPTSFG